MEIVHVYQKQRREFGRQCLFSDRHAQLIADIAPDVSLRDDYLDRDPAEAVIQNAPEFSEHDVNTERSEKADRGMNHTEGGWPKDVDPTEAEQVARYRKKAEKEEVYQQAVVNLGQDVMHCLKQNAALDIYEDFFPEQSEAEALEAPSSRIVNIFKDPEEIKRSISCISWFPDGASKFAAAYSVLEFQKAPANVSLDSYIWDVERPTKPDMTLLPSSPLVSLAYNPKDVHVIIGGQYNGQIAVWDTRKGSRPYETSPIEKSHRDPVHSVKFLQSKTGTDCFSTSTDGQVLWWDIRKLTEPTETLVLDPQQNGRALGGIVLDYESTMPTKFMVGTEQGQIINGNRKGKTAADKLAAVYPGHLGPVYSLQRHPFYPKYFLSVGDWSSRVWCEDLKDSGILWTKYQSKLVTCGTWSPSRPGVAYVGKANGTLDVMDYTLRPYEPILTIDVTDSALSALQVQSQGKAIACGSRAGNIVLVEANNALSVPSRSEKATMLSLFERETNREKVLASRQRELALKQGKNKRPPSGRATSARATSARAGSAKSKDGEGEGEDEEDPIAAAERAFWDSVQAAKDKREKAAPAPTVEAPAH